MSILWAVEQVGWQGEGWQPSIGLVLCWASLVQVVAERRDVLELAENGRCGNPIF